MPPTWLPEVDESDMNDPEFFADANELANDLRVLEGFRWYRMALSERICAISADKSEDVLVMLRLEPTHQFAEFLYLLKAQRIETEAHIERLAEVHNEYIVGLTRDSEKMARLGLSTDRLLAAMFTADTMPRLIQNWRERPGAIDQSNLARLLVLVMSNETCRKVVVACAKAGFLTRDRTPYGTMMISSTGTLERVFAATLREARDKLIPQPDGTPAAAKPAVKRKRK